MASVCAAEGAMLIVNRLVEVAAQLGAGLHLGKPDANTASAIDRARAASISWVSLSAHTDDEVRLAVEYGASAVMVSPIFATLSGALTNDTGSVVLKEPRGLDALQRAVAIGQGRLAIVALGGIDAKRAGECFGSGADAVATMSQWLEGHVDKFVDEWARGFS
jgi:thiamine monophosphate synthase